MNHDTLWYLLALPLLWSAISGALIAVVPGRFAIAVYSPPLDVSGNSVRGILVIEELAHRW